MDSDKSLEEDSHVEFKGVTLRITAETYNQDSNNAGGRNDGEYTSKVQSLTEGDFNKLNNNPKGITPNDVLKPAIWSGADVISPIASLPKKISASIWGSKTSEAKNENCTDIKNNDVQSSCLEITVSKQIEKENPKNFFTFRDGLMENAVKECTTNLIVDNDGILLGSWLLTEISLWDSEKERLILLTENSIITVKYDFIALQQLECRKVPLCKIDTLVTGDLIYPSTSLVPRLNGLANGVSCIVRNCILERDTSYKDSVPVEYENNKMDRGTKGVRIMWNKGQPISLTKLWNPFTQDIPLTTYSSHPLYWHKECEDNRRQTYDVEDFGRRIIDAIERVQLKNVENSSFCKVFHKPIILQNYVSIGSIIHNRNALGFFKVRGKFSF